eukprot:COSAG01_NODE_3649_length_5825_cov_103.068809_1_plen_92_part_10
MDRLQDGNARRTDLSAPSMDQMRSVWSLPAATLQGSWALSHSAPRARPPTQHIGMLKRRGWQIAGTGHQYMVMAGQVGISGTNTHTRPNQNT